MTKYRKKPVVIDAIQYLREENINEVINWLEECNGKEYFKYDPSTNEYYITTLEGEMKVSKNDYIIKGVSGELYPCKPDIFEKTYEKVE